MFTGGLDALKGCMALQGLGLGGNLLTGGLEALAGCTVLQGLSLAGNQVSE